MKLVSFNVNGIRASVNKGLVASLKMIAADVYCFQETKATPEQVGEALKGMEGFHLHAHGAEKPGYSGTAILSREEPARVDFGIPDEHDHNKEGRVITLEYKDFIVIKR